MRTHTGERPYMYDEWCINVSDVVIYRKVNCEDSYWRDTIYMMSGALMLVMMSYTSR